MVALKEGKSGQTGDVGYGDRIQEVSSHLYRVRNHRLAISRTTIDLGVVVADIGAAKSTSKRLA